MSKFEKAFKLFVEFIDWESEKITPEVLERGRIEKEKNFKSKDTMDYLDKLIDKLPDKLKDQFRQDENDLTLKRSSLL